MVAQRTAISIRFLCCPRSVGPELERCMHTNLGGASKLAWLRPASERLIGFAAPWVLVRLGLYTASKPK